MLEVLRHREVIDPSKVTVPIHLIGCGAVGSWTALQLIKLGIRTVTIWDGDKVASHNIANQAFMPNAVDKFKTIAIKKLADDLEVELNIKSIYVNEDDFPENGIILSAVDSMEVRQLTFNKIKYKIRYNYFIDIRMGAKMGRVFFINPIKPSDIRYFEENLYQDAQALISECGIAQTLCPTAMNLASLAVWGLINHLNGHDNPQEVIMDYENFNFVKIERGK